MSLFKKKPLLPEHWQMPVTGEIIPLSELPDQVFAEKMMGAGFAIKASDNLVRSPINGTVNSIFPGGHALTMTSDNGCELLIHIGIDSVGLKGEGFSAKVERGATTKLGDPLVEVDFKQLEEKLPDSAVIIVFVNIEDGDVYFDCDKQQLDWKA